jgi:3-hydroxyisobutyrate dehydrogenase-like beta-hydroxyacid dehydrogenase
MLTTTVGAFRASSETTVRIGILHPGEMGAAIGGLLVGQGHDVLWLPSGRSEATARRAEAAGMLPVEQEQIMDADVVLLVCPPHAAVDVARSLGGTEALVIEANAVSPATATRIAEIIGDRCVDGGIVGLPPSGAGTTRLFLSGHLASDAAAIFAGTNLEPVVLEGNSTAASALKMAYAAWTKGAAALLLAAFALARSNSVDDALLGEWRRSQPGLEARLQAAAESAAAKGWRWVGETQEIATTFAQAGLPPGFAEAAAEVFAASPREQQPDLDALTSALLDPTPGHSRSPEE